MLVGGLGTSNLPIGVSVNEHEYQCSYGDPGKDKAITDECMNELINKQL